MPDGPVWDAPYYQYGYNNFGPFWDIGSAVSAWWDDYHNVYAGAFPGCSYTEESADPYSSDNRDGGYGRVAFMPLSGTCGGWGRVVATEYTDYDPGKNDGSGAGCDGGEGSDGGGGKSGGGPSCPAENGSANSDLNSGVPSAGDPINTATGNKYIQEADFNASPWLTFRRFYNSQPASRAGQLGSGWSHSFRRFLQRGDSLSGASSSLNVYRPSGLREVFRKTGGEWVTSPDNPDALVESVDAQGATNGYTLWIAALRHTETYSADGRLLSIRDETGQTAGLTYSDALSDPSIAPKPGLLLTVVAPDGRALSFTYDASARVHQVTEPDGGTLTYGYDAAGNLTSVQYPDGKTRQYLYNESNLTGGGNLPAAMTGIVDENGVRVEDTAFDGTGRATSTQFAGGAGRVAIQYNADGTSDVTYPLGTVSHQGYATVQGLFRVATVDKPCGECGQPYASRTYDANARPATYTDFNGNVRATTFDANGLLTQQIDGRGSSDQRTIDTTWNATLRVPLLRTVKDASGALVRKEGWAYNASGQVTAQCLIDPIKAPPIPVRRRVRRRRVFAGPSTRTARRCRPPARSLVCSCRWMARARTLPIRWPMPGTSRRTNPVAGRWVGRVTTQGT